MDQEIVFGVQPEPEEDTVNHPNHYTYGSIECIDYLDAIGVGQNFCAGNALKYITRYKNKGKPVEDLKKAVFYIEHIIKKLEDGTYEL